MIHSQKSEIKKSSDNRFFRRAAAIDLFCGCGGMTEGLKQAGFRVLGAVELDPLPLRAYAVNHPEVRTWQHDIRKLDPREVMKELGLETGELELLAGGPPCQGFSTLRTLNGNLSVDDERNGLLLEFARYVEAFMPKAVLMENVPGLVPDPVFEIFGEYMERLGYLEKHRILNAADYGVPQRRRRLLYVALRRGFGTPVFAETAKIRKTVASAIRCLPPAGLSGDPLHDLAERRTGKTMELIRRIPKNGGSRSDLPEEFKLDCHRRCDGFKDVYGRMAWNAPAPTITGGCFNPSKGRFLHPEENRAITMREAALLQGFSKGYIFPDCKNKSALAQMIGNAVPPPFVEAHAAEILKELKKREERTERRG